MTPHAASLAYALGQLDGSAIQELAHQWLSEGIYTPAFNEITALEAPVMDEVTATFECGLAALGIVVLPPFQAAEAYIIHTLKAITQNEISPIEGAELLYWNIHVAFGDEVADRQHVGDAWGLAHLFAWVREIWDLRDSSAHHDRHGGPWAPKEEMLVGRLYDEAVRLVNAADGKPGV